jgi:predicted PurR-regulated permease PerM
METWLSFARRFSRLWGFLVFLGLLLITFREVVLPFLLGIFIAYLLAPVIKRLGSKIGRGAAIVVSYIALLGLFALTVGTLLPALTQDVLRLRDSAPELIERVNREVVPRASEWMDESFEGLVDSEGGGEHAKKAPPEVTVVPQPDGSYRVDLQHLQLEVHEGSDGSYVIAPPGQERDGLGDALKKIVAAKLSAITSWLASVVQVAVPGIFSFVTYFALTFMIAGFLLVDLDKVFNFVRAMVPPEYREDFDELVVGVDRGMSGVIRGQLMICVVNGVLTYIGLLIFSVKYSLLLALIAGVLSLIPIFGTILSTIPIVLIALLSGESGPAFGKALAMFLWIAGIHLLEANLLNPKILGDSAQMHPVVVVFALLAGESMFGLIGALLAVPIASIVQTIFLYVRGQRDPGWGSVGTGPGGGDGDGAGPGPSATEAASVDDESDAEQLDRVPEA